MIKYIRRGLISVAAALSIAAIGVSGVGAQTSSVANGFRISPVRSEFIIDKGKSQTLTVTVENPTDIATTAKAIVNDFVASDDESGTPRLILDNGAPSPKNSFKSLVSTIPDVQLGAREKKDVAVKITVPADSNSGGYYGAIRFLPSNSAQQGNVGLTASVGTIILVTVPGNLTERVDMVQLSAAQNGKARSFFTSGNVQILTRLKNNGDIHVKPFGKVEVKNTFGKVVTSYEFNNVDPRANILPGSTRKFVNDLPKKSMFGRYTIVSNLGYSQGSGNLITAKSSFWYIPTWAVYVILALVVLSTVGLYLLVRRFRGNHNHRAKR